MSGFARISGWLSPPGYLELKFSLEMTTLDVIPPESIKSHAPVTQKAQEVNIFEVLSCRGKSLPSSFHLEELEQENNAPADLSPDSGLENKRFFMCYL